ncbi:iron uptake system protein EfeO [Paenibacillus nasutitermitis]|uniref:Efem/EfeO family lipoprotein n=1 Tax=Paenibacillus nasutitermitis TaxID=1652958 RepID=A0A916Z815_9BACL|nr:iron uptake system protein EfeO [Paenibacillus nasutitermitis]GGD79296.1 Efem/EfeO family lipoprotein [Paenibacillus nasutitermitis]
MLKPIVSVLVLASALALTACNSNGSNNTSNTTMPTEQSETGSESSPANSNNSSSSNVIKDGTTKMLDQANQLQEAIDKQDIARIKSLGKDINDTWLSYENIVRQTFPLEYTDVEKYEMPIFSASAYDKIDFDSLKSNAADMIIALTTLQNAKPSTASSSELLTEAVKKYEQYVVDQANQLTTQTQVFVDAVKAGNIEKAKVEYVKARVYYESIEPIAESFGELDPKIDARLADVDDSSNWTGFHEIEKALWVDNSLVGQDKFADQLITDVKALQEELKALKLDPKTVVAGAMELLNEAATSKITGEEELYSHIDLVDLASNVDGSKTVYLSIIPALNEKNSELADKLDNAFQTMEQKLSEYVKDGQYVLYTELTTDQIREISDQLNTLSDLMSQTAAIL